VVVLALAAAVSVEVNGKYHSWSSSVSKLNEGVGLCMIPKSSKLLVIEMGKAVCFAFSWGLID
jgi:hypothetical protein